MTSQDLADCEKTQAQLQKQVTDLESRLNLTVSDLDSNQAATRDALTKMEAARKLKLSIAGQVKNLIFQQSELEHEIKGKQQRISGLAKQIEKIEPIFGALQRIDKMCRDQGVVGYHGLLIDFLACSSDRLMPCVDIAAKSKLFSVVVDSLETAKRVLEINKQIKGGVINIYPLETLEKHTQSDRRIPPNAKSILEYVSLVPSADQRL